MFKLVVLCSVLAVAASSAIAPLGLGLAGLGVPGLGLTGLGVPGLGVRGLGVPGLGVPGLGVAGLGWGGAWAGPLAAPLAAPIAVGPAIGANYRGPLSLAPGQPANILAADGRPLDTLSVNLDRAAHLTARAVDGHGVHLLKKRSAPLLGAAWSHTARVDIPAARLVGPAYGAPLAAPLAAPLGAPLGLGWGAGIAPVGPVAPLGLGWGHAAAPLGRLW